MYDLLNKLCGIKKLDSKAEEQAQKYDIHCSKDKQVCLISGFYDLNKV
jgi:hypothetical protein